MKIIDGDRNAEVLDLHLHLSRDEMLWMVMRLEGLVREMDEPGWVWSPTDHAHVEDTRGRFDITLLVERP